MLSATDSVLARDRESAQLDDALTLAGLSHDQQVQRYVLGELVKESSRRDPGQLSVAFSVDEDAFLANPAPKFLAWPAFAGATLPPRANPRTSRLSRVLWPLDSVRVSLPGDVSVEGLGGVLESAHGLFHSVQRLDFMESERRIHLLPRPGSPPPNTLPRLELERLENELFDLGKYDGYGHHMTVLAWTEEGEAGAITLYRVLFGDSDEIAGIRPVAAMRDVPTSVLVKMRAQERIKRKVVFAPIDDDDQRYKWRANPSRGPRYIKPGTTQTSASALRSRTRSRSRHAGTRLADAAGVCATTPQFVALLHARHAILEDVKSSSITPMRTDDGDVKPGVVLSDPPRPNPHDGDSVHVAVLIPNEAPWAEEEMIWTDKDGMVEFRQARYWSLIEPASTPRGRGRSRSRSRSRHRAGSQGPQSLPRTQT